MCRSNWLLLALIVSAGCADVPHELSLAGSRPGVDDIIESRLGITVLPGPDGYEGLPASDGGVTPSCSTAGCEPIDFALAVLNGCEVSLTPSPRTTGTCAEAVISAEQHICAANTLLRVVEDPRGAEIGLANSSLQAKGIVSIPPQDAESNFALARLALDHANRAAVDTLAALGSSPCDLAALRAPAGTGPDLPQLTVLDELAQFHREGLTTVARAQESMLRAGATVSDSAYSEDVDTHAAADAILNGFVSRTAAAHVLVGGEMGLPALADPDSGFFAHNRLSADAQAALELMRITAISPALIVADGEIDWLVHGGTSTDRGRFIATRAGLMQGRESLVGATSADQVYELLGISRQGFLDARQHLREELRAFDRSFETRLPAERLASGDDTDGHGIALYAATRSAPRPLVPAYWAAVLRHDPTPTPLIQDRDDYDSPPSWEVVPDSNGIAPGLTYGTETLGSYSYPSRVLGPRSVASLYSLVGVATPGLIGRLVGLEGSCSGTTAAIETCVADLERAQAVLGGAFDEISGTPVRSGTTMQIQPRYDSAEYLGEARACWFSVSETRHDVRLDIRGPIYRRWSTDMSVVYGHDGLDCAVRGEIDGVPCTATQLAELTLLVNDFNTEAEHATAHIYDAAIETGARPRPDTTTLFIVSNRDEWAGGPGGFDPVVGFVLPRPSLYKDGYRYCQTAVIAPELDRAVQRLVEPSTTAPFMSTQSCAGMSMDQLIPLENELTDDGNGIESSWRYYLEQARVAAARADDLGDQLVRSGLEMDLRGEAAADELNRICGVSINVSSLQEAMAADPLPAIGGVPPCAAPYVDRGGGICSRDPVLYAAMLAARSDESGRLASCLGGDTVARATFGDTRLCIWDSNEGAPGGICGGPNPAQTACPAPVASGVTTCDGLPDAPSGTSWILVEDTIGLFARPTDPVPTAPNPLDLPCAELARSREGVASIADLAAIYGSPLFSFDGFRVLGRSLSWDANVGDFSTVRYAGGAVFGTGSPNTGAALTVASPWPMGDSMPLGTTCPNPAMYNPVAVPGPPPSGAYTAAAGNVDLQDYQGSLFCLGGMRDGARVLGEGHDAVRAQRATMNNVLARAVLAARIFSGNTLAPMRLPYYRGSYVGRLEIDQAYEEVVNSGVDQTLCGESARVMIDHSSDFFSDGAYERPLADLGERECVVTGTDCGHVSGVTEWTHCPGSSCVPHDFGCMSPEGWNDHQLILGSPGSVFDRHDAIPTALANWPTLSSFVLRAYDLSSAERWTRLIGEAVAGPLSNPDSYTTYWNAWGCGQDDFDNCMDADNALYAPGANQVAFGSLTVNDWLNGVELACVAARQSEPSILTSACGEVPEVTSIVEGNRVASFFECQANEISSFGANAIVENLPARVVSALQAQSTGQFGNGAGEFDAQVSDIRGALIDMANARIAMSSDLRVIASVVRAFRARISQHERVRKIEELLAVSNVLDRAMGCVSATAGSSGVQSITGGAIASAVATCANAAAQSVLTLEMARLRDANIDDELIQAYADFNITVSGFGRSMAEHNLAVRSSLERLDGALARVRSSQTQARRALARALLLEDDGTEAHSAVTSTYRAINNTALVRYRRAHDRALRAAFIARRSIEQRLGMSLEDIEDDVYSDDPPSAWVNRLCRLPAIDYDRIRAGSTAALDGGVGGASDVLPPDDYSGAYIGDYLDQLEGAFRSYNFVYPFHEGTDTAVISLRDDIFRSRAPCPVESGNLLFAGGNLGQREGTTRAGWRMTGCEAPGSGASPCLAVAAIDGDGYCTGSLCSTVCMSGEIGALDGDGCCPPGATVSTDDDCLGAAPVSGSSFDLGWPQPYRLKFGGAGSTAASRLEQHLVLAPGRYRISWYARAGTPGAPAVTDVVGVETTSGTSLIDHGPYAPIVVSGWSRVWAFVTVLTEQEVIVTIHDSYEFVVDSMIDVTGVMLEDVSDSLRGDLTHESGTDGQLGSISSPPAWTDAGTHDRRICADTRGLYFRSEAWEPGCVRVCPDGYDGNCSDELAEHRCFRQTSLGISSESLTRLLVSTPTGFAGGNYNYRIDNVAVNLVGTALRDCTGAGAGCYGAGNFWYSMLHAGPYVVRNARGGLYETPLFPGRLESARALASERYFTNPISSADQSLIQSSYTRLELQGRPLAGTLILRLWDEPGFRFDRLEDVQIVLTYRYWGHQR